MSYNCTKCSSENTQKFSLIYRNGTSNVDLTTVGAGISSAIGVGAATTKGSTQSSIATKCAPPEKMGLFGPAVTLFILALISAIFFGEVAVWIGVVLAAAYVVGAVQHNRQKYPVEFAEWDRKFLCLRCENEFQV